jgi:hypothetical protein
MAYKHESIAKAEIKGAFTRSNELFDELERLYESRAGLNFGSKKLALSNIGLQKKSYGDFLIEHVNVTRRQSWHFQSYITAIETEYTYFENVGNLTRFVFNHWDTRGLMKMKAGSHTKYFSQIWLHEHFLIRTVQRLGLTGIQEVGKSMLPLVNAVIKNNINIQTLGENTHFITRDYVIIASKISDGSGLIFKTLLLAEFFTETQQRKYAVAIEQLAYETNHVILLNESSEKLFSLSLNQCEGPLISQVESYSFWLKAVWEDIQDRYL